jgi:hypothetical protein
MFITYTGTRRSWTWWCKSFIFLIYTKSITFIRQHLSWGVRLDMVQEWEKLFRNAQMDIGNVHHSATAIGNQSTHFFTSLATYSRKRFCYCSWISQFDLTTSVTMSLPSIWELSSSQNRPFFAEAFMSCRPSPFSRVWCSERNAVHIQNELQKLRGKMSLHT